MLARIGIPVLVIALVIGGFWWVKRGSPKTAPAPAAQTTTTAPANNTGSILTKESSNASLDQDLTIIDSQMKSLDTDSANVDQSLNDKPIPQTE